MTNSFIIHHSSFDILSRQALNPDHRILGRRFALPQPPRRYSAFSISCGLHKKGPAGKRCRRGRGIQNPPAAFFALGALLRVYSPHAEREEYYLPPPTVSSSAGRGRAVTSASRSATTPARSVYQKLSAAPGMPAPPLRDPPFRDD